MSVFTPGEIEYLTSQGLARLATVGPDGQPHVVPVTLTFNAEEEAIDVGGVDFGSSKRWRDAKAAGVTPKEFRPDARSVG